MECEVCGRELGGLNEVDLCHLCRELVELEENREEVREKWLQRTCLRCDCVFWAQGRFNRICPRCTEKNRKVAQGGSQRGAFGTG